MRSTATRPGRTRRPGSTYASAAAREAEGLAELLNGRPEIKRAHREDREFILVDAARLTLATMEGIVAEEWAKAAEGTQYRQFNEDGDLVDAERPASLIAYTRGTGLLTLVESAWRPPPCADAP